MLKQVVLIALCLTGLNVIAGDLDFLDNPDFLNLENDYQKATFIINHNPDGLTYLQKQIAKSLFWRYLVQGLVNNDDKDFKKQVVDIIKQAAQAGVANPNEWAGRISQVDKRKALLKDPTSKLAQEKAKEILPCYYNLLDVLKEQEYQFINCDQYVDMDRKKMKNNVLILRHDIHYEDIPAAYIAYFLERDLAPHSPHPATYYVMLSHPTEKNAVLQKAYLKIINFLKGRKVDVQPHISPIDLYLDKFPREQWTQTPVSELQKLFESNYKIEQSPEGITLQITGKDLLGFKHFNDHIADILRTYNLKWQEDTGLKVSSYAAHGSSTNINKVFSNAQILNQVFLLKEKIYQFDTYNTTFMNGLQYLSDNTQPLWIEYPELIKPGKYQFLMHPNVWWEKFPIYKEGE